MRALMALTCLALMLPAARADRCEKVGCVGAVYYLHVPRGQLKAPLVFQFSGLPNVNDTVALADAGSLLPSISFDTQWLADLRRDLALAVLHGASLPGWGFTLRTGARVKILSYQKFPQLEAQSDELFALVLVISD
jgi:hypothetical protein